MASLYLRSSTRLLRVIRIAWLQTSYFPESHEKLLVIKDADHIEVWEYDIIRKGTWALGSPPEDGCINLPVFSISDCRCCVTSLLPDTRWCSVSTGSCWSCPPGWCTCAAWSPSRSRGPSPPSTACSGEGAERMRGDFIKYDSLIERVFMKRHGGEKKTPRQPVNLVLRLQRSVKRKL